MAYLKKEYVNLLKRIDNELKLPKGWQHFVEKESAKQNLIIKSKGICTCNNCKTQFKSNKKINDIEKCPNCKNEYLIKRSTYQYHLFENDLILVQKLDDKLVIRLFEIFTRYGGKQNETYHSSAAEYGRIILQDRLEFVNDRVVSGMWGNQTVCHTREGKKWRIYNKYYSRLSAVGKIYYKNLKEVFKNTEYKYSQLWTLAAKEDELDLCYLLNSNLTVLELLIKMKLYKLALCPRTFNIKGSFEKRFGVNKSYYNFMKKNNIDIDELNVLKIYKTKNIENIRYLTKFRLDNLIELKKYVSLDEFIKYSKENKTFDLRLYLDYLGFLKTLKLDLKNKQFLFPEDLALKHDEYEKQIKIRKNTEISKKIGRRYKRLNKNSYSNNTYCIIPAKDINDLEEESRQQKNCVRTYAEKYAKGECDIYFMRKKDNINKSLVTVEVKNNEIVQSRGKCNQDITSQQKMFLDKWQKEILNAA